MSLDMTNVLDGLCASCDAGVKAPGLSMDNAPSYEFNQTPSGP